MEINSHYGVLEYARSVMASHGYRVHSIRQADDGTGSIGVVRSKGKDMSTAVPYSLPVDGDKLHKRLDVLGTSEDTGEAWDRSRQK